MVFCSVRQCCDLCCVMDNLEEDLTCSVCYCLFTDPRVLPCSHTFCKGCLDNVLQVSVNFSIWRPLRLPLKCPQCRSVVELPTNGVDALPVNVCLRAIVEKYQRDDGPRSPPCPEHPRQPLNVYCVQDRKLICGFCLTIGQHQGHAIDDLQTAYMKERAAQPRLLEPLRGKCWEEVCGLTERLQQEKLRSEELVQNDREVVLHFFQDLDLILTQKKEQFLQALDGASVLLARAYNPLIEQLKDMQEEQSDLISLSSSVEREDCPLVYLEKVHQLRERVNVLSQKTLPEVPRLHITPRAEQFFEEHWARVTIVGLRDGPLPEITCRTQVCSMNGTHSTSQTRFWRLVPSSALVLILLMLILMALCLNPMGGSSLGFSVLSGVSHIVQNVSSELHDMGKFLLCLLQNINMTLRSSISTLGENTYQHLLTFLQTLH
ncbi:tripartite motif-containing protein 59-like isoform X1 [Myxocyprinus asiaticus]|uniref:tripartite motif-containing protein 59-like isoform X1 n=2 Tax=Myxocyprinus asiaticus TaxID=70543 RepID=UPI002221FD64|nr:tripartite motif-containing protein 59-like isoform X1 [Myxocyprinus asiaticus]